MSKEMIVNKDPGYGDSQKSQALKLMPDILTMLESDLIKATFDLEKAIRVAVFTEDTMLVNYLAQTLSALSDSSERIQALTEKTVLKENQSE